MSQFNFVNLNDAIYISCNRSESPQQPYALRGITSFSKAYCPRIEAFKSNQLLTYRDWIKLVSGRMGDTIESACFPGYTYSGGAQTWDNGCYEQFANNDWYNATYGYCCARWGITVGARFKGKDGRPLAEDKLLDTGFWYYKNVAKELAGGTTFGLNESRIFCTKYAHPNWQPNTVAGTWYYPNVYEPTNAFSNWVDPGIYAGYVVNNNSKGRVSSNLIAQDENGKNTVLARARVTTGTGWSCSNVIFFVDSPVRFYNNYTNENSANVWDKCTWLTAVYRLTPPDYWE